MNNSKDIKKFKGKVALVTGASRGIGSDITEALIETGVYVIGTATTKEGAERISSKMGSNGRGIKLDVSFQESVDEVFNDINENEGSPSIIINNAGIAKDSILMKMKSNDWDEVISTNLSGIYRICKLGIRAMIKSRYGRIVNIASIIGHIGNPGQTNYAAAKAGIIGFSKSLAREVATRNITVNVVSPGFILTDMTNALSDAQKNEMLEKIPLGRFGTGNEVANAVIYLVSDSASYITGQTLHVNGGMLMD